MANTDLNKAKRNKNDEFYTQLVDIENELKHYRHHFKDKIVFCNCDDPFESNFVKYFAMNFNFLGLKKLVATCYDDSPVAFQQETLFAEMQGAISQNLQRRAYKIEITHVEDCNGDGAVDLTDIRALLKSNKNCFSLLQGNGDFRSDECVELLKEADIVVTNPPFSLLKEFVAQLFNFKKSFLILGNINAITYRDVFPLIMDDKIWLGYKNGAQDFLVPNSFEKKNTYVLNGRKFAKFGNICWFTNLDTQKRHEHLTLYKRYNTEEYPKYDNYDAINIDRVYDIPYDYDGVMGVPITFMDKYNPEQFEIVGATESEGKGFSNGLWIETSGIAQPVVKGNRIYKRIFIRRKY